MSTDLTRRCQANLSPAVVRSCSVKRSDKSRGTVAHRTRGPNGDPLGKVTGAQVRALRSLENAQGRTEKTLPLSPVRDRKGT